MATRLPLAVAALLALAACAPAEPPRPAAGSPGASPATDAAALAGTSWNWVRFRSAAEDVAVPAPERYTLAFPEAGRLALRADCNRGAGGVAFPEAGAIRVGAVALTRAMCPPGSLSDRYVQDLSRATRWSVRGDELRLDLPDDSGALLFTRAR